MTPGYDGIQSIAFFSPDVTDVSTIKRADMFTEKDFSITVFGFRRARYNRDFQPRWPYVELGETRDGSYARRALSLLKASFVLFRHRTTLRRASRFYARNIDQLILAAMVRMLIRSQAPITYEVLDIQPVFVGNGMRARLLRFVERVFLKRVSLIVVSSPGFMHNYFEPVQAYRGDWFLLENKLHASAVPTLETARSQLATDRQHKSAEAQKYKWVVNYAGLIRGQRTLNLITRLAEKFENDILFRFYGILTTVNPEAFRGAIESHENMVYGGEYVNPRDLTDIYRDADFVWALDLENVDNNSRWLLPCRFYEAGYLGLPCLVARDFEVGRKVESLDAGWTFSAPFDDTLFKFFEQVTRAEYAEKRRRITELPASTFLAQNDGAALCHFISDPALHSSRKSRSRRREGARQLTPAHAGFRD